MRASASPGRRGLVGLFVAGLLVGGLLLTGCTALSSNPAHGAAVYGDGTPPGPGTTLDRPVPAAIAALPLTDEHGRPVTLASLHGKTVVLADFLTLCQEVCPLTSVNLQEIDDAVRRAGLSSDVVLLEVTVDPVRDTPQQLAAYQKLFGARPNWVFATGSQATLKSLWWFFGVAFNRVPETDRPAPRDWLTGKPMTYDVDHQDVVWVLDPRGHAVWEDDGNADTAGQAPPTRLGKFLSAEGRRNLAHPNAASWSAADVEQAVSRVTGVSIG